MFSLADFAILILIILSFRKENFFIRKYDLIFYLIILVTSVVGMMLNFDREYFSMYEFSTSLLKLLFYLVGVTIIPHLLIGEKIDVIKICRCVFFVLLIGELIQVIIVKIFGFDSWSLYSLGSHLFGLETYDTMTVVGRPDMVRPRSLCLLLLFILQVSKL